MSPDTFIVVAALDEADRIGATLAALARAFPGAPVFLADDGSTDATAELARAAGATVVRSERIIGKGQAMTAGVRAVLSDVDFFWGPARACAPARGYGEKDNSSAESSEPSVVEPSVVEPSVAEPIVVLCDGDLGDCADRLGRLADAVRSDHADVAVAVFARRVGGGFGLALRFARWAIRRRCGLLTRAPISGQRALRAGVLRDVLPFAPGFGMEIGMTIDAVRAGHRLLEIDLDLAHRATGRTPAGFAHRARQLVDFMRVYLARA
ncbi:MAG TPA: glycosyltransferase [Solirubrobacteraceae bacterium]|nr:glycosyltransferase [Solirubrobacteraceae bacterium]